MHLKTLPTVTDNKSMNKSGFRKKVILRLFKNFDLAHYTHSSTAIKKTYETLSYALKGTLQEKTKYIKLLIFDHSYSSSYSFLKGLRSYTK